MHINTVKGTLIAELSAKGAPLTTEQDALDVIGECFGTGVHWVLIPIKRVSPELFTLSNGSLGAISQKFENYRLRVAIAGDISEQVNASDAFRDFVVEANARGNLIFVETKSALYGQFT